MQFNVIDQVLFYFKVLIVFYNSIICYGILFEK